MQYFIWIFLILLGFVFVKNRYVAALLFIFDWIIFSFNRGNADYIPYMQIFNQAQISMGFDFISESGWQLLCVFSRDFLHIGYEGFRILVSTIALILLYRGAIHYTRNIALFLALFNVFPVFLCVVQLENFLAFSVVFYGLRFLEKKKVSNLLVYVLFVLLATTIHLSSLFYILFLLAVYIDNSKLTKIVFIWCIVGIGLVIPLFAKFSIFGKYSIYLKGELSLFSKICILVLLTGLHLSVLIAHLIIKKSPLTGNNHANRAIAFSELALRISTLGFMMLPIMYYVSIEAMRFNRYITIIDYVLISLPNSKLDLKRVFFIRLLMLAIAIASCWYWQMGNNFLNTVFKSCLENNSIIKFLFQ